MKKLWGKVFRKLGWALGGLLGLALALHTPPARNVVRGILARFGEKQIHGRVEVGRLNYRLWRGTADLRDVGLELPGLKLRADRVQVALFSKRGLSLEVDRLRAVISPQPRSGPTKSGGPGPSYPWSFLDKLGAVRVTDLFLELGQGTSGRTVSGSLTLDSRADDKGSGGRSWSVRARLSQQLAGHPPVPLVIDGVLGLEGKGLRLDPVRLSSNGNSLALGGTLRQAKPLEGNIGGEMRVDTSLTSAFGLDLPVRAALAGSIRLEAVNSGLRGSLDIAASSLTAAGTGPWTAEGTARLEGKTILVEKLDLHGYGGSIAAEGRLDLALKNLNMRARASGLDVNALAAVWAGGIPRLGTRAEAEVELSLENWEVSRARAKGQLTLAAVPGSGLPVSGRLNVELEKQKLRILSEGLRIADGSADVKAALDKRGIDAQYALRFPASGLRDVLSTIRPGLPRWDWEGFLSASGGLTGAYHNLSATASITSEELMFQSGKISVGANLEWGKSGLHVRSARVSSGAGELKLQGSVPLATPAGRWDLSATMEAFDLSAFVAKLGISASADGSLTVQGPARAPDWTARLEVSLKDRGKAPRQAAISLAAHGRKQAVSLDELRAEIGGGSLAASGAYRLDSDEISGRLKGTGIRIQDVAGLPESLDGLKGVLAIDGELSGKPGTPVGSLGLVLEDLSIKGSSFPKQSLNIVLEGGEARFTGLAPEPFLTGSCRLLRPYTLQAKVDLSPLPYNSLLAAFPALSRIKIAAAAGTVQLQSNLEDLRGIRWRADVDEIKGTFDKQEWTMTPFAVDGGPSSLRLSGFRMQGQLSSLAMDGTLPLSRVGTIDVKLDGRLGLEVLPLFFPGLEIKGSAELGLHLQGTPVRPVLKGDLSVSSGSGRWRGISWENFELRARADDDQVLVEKLSFQAFGGEVKASGNLSLSPAARGGEVAFEWSRLDVGWLLPAASSPGRPFIRTSGKGQVSILGLKVSSLSGRGQISELVTSLGDPPISLQEAVDWTLDKGSFSHSPFKLVGEKTDLDVRLRYSPTAARPEFNARLAGTFNAAAVSAFFPGSGVSFADLTTINLEIGRAAGALSGQLSLDGGRIQLADPPLSATQIQARLSVKGTTLEVTSIKAAIGSGSLEASGRLEFNESGTPPRADLRLALANVPFVPAEGIQSVVSGQLRLAGDAPPYALTGEITVPRAYFRKEMDAASESLSLIDRQLNVLEGRSSPADDIALKVRIQVRDFRVENSLAELSAEGILTVAGTVSRPEIGGSITVGAGGSLNLGRAQIEIGDGRVVLDGYPDEPVRLEVSGITRVSGVYIELKVRGPLDNLQTQLQAPYRSDLTQGDLLMLLMTGRTSQAAVSEAGAVAAESLAGALGDRLQKSAGESVYIDISSDQSFFSYDTDPITWFSLGKEVLPGLYVIYAKDLEGTRQRAVLSYTPKEKPVRLRLIGEDDGRTMVELNHRLEVGLRAGQDRGGEPPARERIGRLTFEGRSPLDDQALRKRLKLKPGKKYDAWAAQAGADKLQLELAKLGYRNARVEVQTSAAGPGLRDVRFLIDAGKRVLIVWKGDEIGKPTRKAVEAFWSSATPEDISSETLARQAEFALRADRYYLARVTAERRADDDELTVVLQVRKGPRGERLALRFRGNTVLADKDLAAALPPPKEPGFFEAIEGGAARVRNALRGRYAAAGYLQMDIQPVETAYNKETGEFLVTVPVVEGTLSTVAEIRLPAEIAGPAGQEGPDLRLKVGEPFRIEHYLQARSALGRYYREQGYIQARVAGILKPTEDKVSVTFTVSDTVRPRVGNIRLARPGRTREGSVRNLMTLKKGDLVLPTEVDRSRKHLFDTRAFKSVDIQAVEAPGNPETRDLVVDLIEKKDIELNYGLRYQIDAADYTESSGSDTYSPLEVGGQVQLLNLFGRANRYGVSGYLFGKQQSARAFFEAETFFRLPFPTQVYASTEQNSELEISGLETYIQKIAFQQYYRLGESVQASRWTERLRLLWNYSFRNIRLTPLETDMGSVNTDRGSVSLSLIADTRDSFINPTRGAFWSVASEFCRTWLGSDVNFDKLFGQGFLYVRLTNRVIWVSGLRLGVVPGENPFLTIEDRFKAGGPSTVRAFALNSLGPQNAMGEPLGGQALAVFNQELRFPLYKSLDGGVFYDAGNVFLFASELSLGDLRHCAGAGLRYNLPFGPIRLDWAYVLDPEPGEERYRFVLALGHAF